VIAESHSTGNAEPLPMPPEVAPWTFLESKRRGGRFEAWHGPPDKLLGAYLWQRLIVAALRDTGNASYARITNERSGRARMRARL
jgi:hypothetical protein